MVFFLISDPDLPAVGRDDADKAAREQHIGQGKRQDGPQERQAQAGQVPLRRGSAQPDERQGAAPSAPAMACPFAASWVT